MSLSLDTIITASVSDDQARLSTESCGTVFRDLAISTKGMVDKDIWLEGIKGFEDEYMENYFGADPQAKHTDGKWKYRTYLPMAWSSSKAVCGQAIELGIILDSTSTKTLTERMIKEKRAAATAKTPRQKLRIVMGTAQKIIDQMTDIQKDDSYFEYGLDRNVKFWSK